MSDAGWHPLLEEGFDGYEVHESSPAVRSWRGNHGMLKTPRALQVKWGSVLLRHRVEGQRRYQVSEVRRMAGLAGVCVAAEDEQAQAPPPPDTEWLPLPLPFRGYEVSRCGGWVRSWRTNSSRRARAPRLLRLVTGAARPTVRVQVHGRNLQREISDLLELALAGGAEEEEPALDDVIALGPELSRAVVRLEAHIEMLDDTVGRLASELAASRDAPTADLGPVLARLDALALAVSAAAAAAPPPPPQTATEERRRQREVQRWIERRELAVVFDELGAARASELLGVGPRPALAWIDGRTETVGGLDSSRLHAAYVAVEHRRLETTAEYEEVDDAVQELLRVRRRDGLAAAAWHGRD